MLANMYFHTLAGRRGLGRGATQRLGQGTWPDMLSDVGRGSGLSKEDRSRSQNDPGQFLSHPGQSRGVGAGGMLGWERHPGEGRLFSVYTGKPLVRLPVAHLPSLLFPVA